MSQMSVFRRNNYIFLQDWSLATSSKSALSDIRSFGWPFCLLTTRTSGLALCKASEELGELLLPERDYVFMALLLYKLLYKYIYMLYILLIRHEIVWNLLENHPLEEGRVGGAERKAISHTLIH